MKATKYEKVETLPVNAVTISQFARDKETAVGYVYVKFDRGKADYKIINFQGINFVIPSSTEK